MKCLQCGIDTSNPKFCSRSCSTVYNNIRFPKRKVVKKCSINGCENPSKGSGYKYCKEHTSSRHKWGGSELTKRTVGEYRSRDSVKGKHQSWLHSGIRGLSRHWNRDLQKLPCAICGYSKHVEICHVKPVSLFSDNDLIGDVNARNNLVQLCPNCHWEFDNGLIPIDKINDIITIRDAI